MTPTRPVAIVANGAFYVGPALARQLATRGYDLVVGSPSTELVAELEALGASLLRSHDLGDSILPVHSVASLSPADSCGQPKKTSSAS